MKSSILLATACLATALAHASTLTFAPGPNVQTELQEALILAEPGTTFHLEAGTYEFTMGLSLDVDDVIIQGEGMDKTILSFKNQDVSPEGLYVTSDNVVVQDLAIEDAKGNAFKSNGTKNLVLRNVRTEWTNGPDEKNGAYGLYPVSSENVLIDGCVAIGASDAGIYVGQTKNVIVKNSRAEYNVAGIEIENCHNADVFDCVATNNTGGILVFDLPGLPMQKGHNVRVFRNKVVNNDTPNFAPAGNIVATVSRGTGISIMSNTQVEVFENKISDNRTYGVVICSYLTTGIEITDPEYYPYAEAIYIHNNTFGKNGWDPSGKYGKMTEKLAGRPFPEVLWDGVLHPDILAAGGLKDERRIIVENNTAQDGEMNFVNLNLAGPLGDEDNSPTLVTRDLAPHRGEHRPVPEVVLAGLE